MLMNRVATQQKRIILIHLLRKITRENDNRLQLMGNM